MTGSFIRGDARVVGYSEPVTVPWWRRPAVWLVVVAVAHAVAPLLLLGAHWAFGPDETVYLSQLNGRIPPEYFSAPRARGSTLLAAPVTLLTSSVAAVRVWVTALSGLGLWLGFRPWLRLAQGWVVPLGAAAFASLWTVTFYGFEVMPNEWVAFATLGGCGACLRWIAERRRRHLFAAGTALLIVALLRPSDAAYTVVGITVGLLLMRLPWRAWFAAVVAVGLGAAGGALQWVLEAETSFGGVAARIHAAQAEQGGSGLYWAGPAQARALAGPVLCRGTCRADAGLVYRLWWIVLAVLIAAAMVVAIRRGRDRAVVVVSVAVGVIVAAQYLFTVPYAAPRFLLPAYALLAVPTMLGARAIVRAVHAVPWRRPVASVLAAGLVAATVVQVLVLTRHIAPSARTAAQRLAAQADALADAGVRDECLLLGNSANNLQLSYALGCVNGPRTPAQIRAAVRDGQVVWLRATRPSRRYDTHWRHVLLPHSQDGAWVHSEPARPDERG